MINPLLTGQKYIPSILKVSFTAGLSDLQGNTDPLINNTVGLIAAAQLLQMMGDIGTLGGQGVASASHQIDGLNQNLATTATLGNLYKVTIDNYNKIIQNNKKILKKNYNRINFSCA